MTFTQATRDAGPTQAAVAAGRRRGGFTLVELMVVIVIIGILASLTLAGLAGVRQRAKIEKTKSTIRKIDAVIRPMYESYRTRRVRLTQGGAAGAVERLARLRLLMASEMPDDWSEVGGLSNPTAAARRYFDVRNRLDRPNSRFQAKNPATDTTFGSLYAAAECLFLISAFGGYEPEALEMFRADEVGDVDRDGANEFLDAWGVPIMFIRWPIAYQPVIGPLLPRNPDPLDPFQRTKDFAVTPLIYSAGPDGALADPLGSESGYGIRQGNLNPPWTELLERWLNSSGTLDTATWTWAKIEPTDPDKQPGAVLDPNKVRDNITNYDLLKK